MRQGPLAFLADLGPRGLPGRLGRKELLARKVHKARLAEMVSRALWGSLVQLALWGPLEKMEIRARLGSQDRRGARGIKANRVHLGLQVPKVPLDSQALPELTASLVPEASRAFLGRKVTRVQEVFMDPPGPWGCRACRDPQERRARRATWVRWALPVPPAPEGPPELQVLTGLRAPQVESAILVLWERRVNLAKLESLAFLVKGAPRDQKERGERRASQALLALQDPRDPRAHLETTAPRAAPVRLVSLEILVPLESLAPRVRMVPLVTKVMTARPDKRDPPALLVNQVLLDLQEKGVPPAPQALKADRERKGPREKLAWKALPGRLAPLALRGPPGSRGLMACEGSPARWASRVSQDPQALTGPPAPWGPQDSLASKEILALKEKRVIQA